MLRFPARASLALLALATSAAAQAGVWESPESNVIVPQVHSFVLQPDARRLHVS